MKFFVFDPLWNKIITPEQQSRLGNASIELSLFEKVTPLTECKELFDGDEDRIICMNPDYFGWKLSSEDYRNVPNLKSLMTMSTGFEWIDTAAAAEKGIKICNIKDFSTNAVAESAIMIMLNLARQTPRLIKDGFPLDFDKDFMGYRGVELKGKTAGIIGLGNIGSAITEKCQGLGMEVTYWSANSRNKDYNYLELSDLMKTADVIFPIMASNNTTDSLITDELLASVKPSSIIVSMAHKLLNFDKMAAMVKEGSLYGCGFEAEPKTFTKYEGNVWAAPAYAWATKKTMENSIDKLIDNIIAANHGSYPNHVN